MTTQWWQEEERKPDVRRLRAVAYYRHSAQIGQENSVEIQQDNVRAFAEKHDIEIVGEYADRGKSGLTVEGRDQFKEMMKRVEEDNSFQLVLCYDVSRWGRFQDTDLSALYDAQCSQHGKKVVYTAHGMVNESSESDKLLNLLRKDIDRYQAADYSRGLSKKVLDGQIKVSKQGYRPGGPPPYGTFRLMLDEHKKPDRILQPGQRKAIQNGRIVLVPGDPAEQAIIREIFRLFVEDDWSESQISGHLNAKNVPSPGGVQWSSSSVHHILSNEQYAGAAVFNKTTQKLKTPRRLNPKEKWVVTPGSYTPPVIAPELFEKAREKINGRKRRFSPEEMQTLFREIYGRYGMFSTSLVWSMENSPTSGQIKKQFGSMPEAFQSMFTDVIETAKNRVFNEIADDVRNVNSYRDFLVIDERFTVKIQPAVAQPFGYGYQWFFRLDKRAAVDIVLGVPLADTEEREILGFFPITRFMTHEPYFAISNNSMTKFQMHGYTGLEFIREMARTGVCHDAE